MATDAYEARILAYSAGKDPLAMQKEAPALVDKLIDGVDESRLGRRPSPGKWSVREIVAHLAEDEIASSWRYRQMLESSGVTLAAFDQDKWAAFAQYSAWSTQEAARLYRLLREANVRLLAALTAEQLQCFGIHAERGRLTIAELVRHMAGHDRNHIDQIGTILAA
jgi:uncharacterized damage-inducible protein DinB